MSIMHFDSLKFAIYCDASVISNVSAIDDRVNSEVETFKKSLWIICAVESSEFVDVGGDCFV